MFTPLFSVTYITITWSLISATASGQYPAATLITTKNSVASIYVFSQAFVCDNKL